MRSNVTSLSKFLSVLLVITVLSIVANATFGKYFENFLFQGNTIQATNTNGSIVLRPAGSGTVDYYGKGTVMGTSTTDIVANKSFTDSVNYFTDNSDSSKKLQFELSGITASTTRTVTMPDASGEMVLKNNSQVLSNKFFLAPNVQDYLIIGGAAADREVRFYDVTTNYVAVKAANPTANYTLTYPSAAPTSNGQVQTYSTAGIASFSTITTPWVAYTPTFVGAGTVTAVSVWSRRVGDSLQIRGNFTTGTVTATVATFTLGFNGTNSSVTLDTAKLPSTNSMVGNMMPTGGTGGYEFPILAVPANTGTLSFGISNAGTNGFTAQGGTGVFSSTSIHTLNNIQVPITGW